MKVLVATRSYLFNVVGGGDVQVEKTSAALRKRGVKVVLLDKKIRDISKFDILHIFAPSVFSADAYSLALHARKSGVKVATSSVFWLPVYKTRALNVLKINPINKMAIRIGNSIPMYGPSYLKLLFETSDMVLPNTDEERKIIKSVFDIRHNRFSVVPNGVDNEFKDGNKELFKRKFGIENFILFVGRIERRKNLLKLIKAFETSGLDTELVILGSVAEEAYYKSCNAISNKKVKFIGPMDHASRLLKSAYKAAKVVVLPSYYETPGLSALEGGLAGANIAITKVGGTDEYFGKFADYLDPYSINSIRKAIVAAYERPRSDKLQNHILENFTWDSVAKKTIQAYKSIL
jgi:glycosyltransferase involved in cell wall biosynthesis